MKSASLSRNRRTSGRDRWWSLVQRNCIETTRVIKYSRIRAAVVWPRRGRESRRERRKHESSTRVWSLAYRRLPHDSSTRALDLYRSIGYERLQLETAETQLVCGIYFQCSPREHWMVIKKNFSLFSLFPFYAVRIGGEPSAHVTAYSSRPIFAYTYIEIV